MANVISQQAPPPPSLPAMNERRALCSHTTMERVFSTAQHTVRCQICDESEFGWVYACTEDRTRGTGNDDPTHDAANAFKEENDVELNNWVVKAIEDGHYTEAQIKTLLSHRINVQELIANGNKPATPQNASEARPTITKNLGALTSEQPSSFAEKMELLWKTLRANRQQGSPATPCRLQLCHFCFPSGSERTWLSLNEVCSTSYNKDTFPSHISQVPSSEITRVRRTLSDAAGAAEALDVKTTDAGSINASYNDARDYDSANDVDERESLSTDNSSGARSASCDQDTLLSTFKNYEKQQLGTPRKISKCLGSFSPSNENVPPGQTQSGSTQNKKWSRDLQVEAGVEDGWMKPVKSENSGLKDADIMTQT